MATQYEAPHALPHDSAGHTGREPRVCKALGLQIPALLIQTRALSRGTLDPCRDHLRTFRAVTVVHAPSTVYTWTCAASESPRSCLCSIDMLRRFQIVEIERCRGRGGRGGGGQAAHPRILGCCSINVSLAIIAHRIYIDIQRSRSLKVSWPGLGGRLHTPAYEQAVVGLVLASNVHHGRAILPSRRRSALAVCSATQRETDSDGAGGARSGALEAVDRGLAEEAAEEDDCAGAVTDVDLRGLKYTPRVRQNRAFTPSSALGLLSDLSESMEPCQVFAGFRMLNRSALPPSSVLHYCRRFLSREHIGQ
jgi:hypothetical protein